MSMASRCDSDPLFVGHCVWYQDAAEVRSRACLAYRHCLDSQDKYLIRNKGNRIESENSTQQFVTCRLPAAFPDGPSRLEDE